MTTTGEEGFFGWLAEFARGNPTFNVLTLVVSLVGLLVAFKALRIALNEIAKVVDVVDASDTAAKEAQLQIVKITAVVTLGDLTSLCKELINALKQSDKRFAAQRASDLRMNVVKAREHDKARKSLSQKAWQKVVGDVARIHDAAEARLLGVDEGASQMTEYECITLASEVLQALTAASSKVVKAAGE